MIALYKIFAYLIITIQQILLIYQYILIISIFLSWVRPDPYNPIVRIIYSLTEPVLGWVRRRFHFLRVGMLDLSPLAVFFLIFVIRDVILNELLRGLRILLLT